MPNWNQINDEIAQTGSTYDVLRRKYLFNLHSFTHRNVIVYYSGWLQKQGLRGIEVNDGDKNGFMSVIHKLGRSKGLDLILHTPGGEVAATESIVDYLRSMFGNDIRVIVPQLALSAGTMIACASKQIVMGKQSSLGPIDPQIGGIPTHGVIEEFKRAHQEIRSDPSKIPIWQPIIAKYPPAFIGECEKSISWAEEIVKEWLLSGMLKGKENAELKADKIISDLGSHALTKSHARHLSMERCKEIGLDIVALEDDDKFQDMVLSVHHICIHTLSATGAFKIIENHLGTAFIQVVQNVVIKG